MNYMSDNKEKTQYFCSNPNCGRIISGPIDYCRLLGWHINTCFNYFFCPDHNKNPY